MAGDATGLPQRKQALWSRRRDERPTSHCRSGALMRRYFCRHERSHLIEGVHAQSFMTSRARVSSHMRVSSNTVSATALKAPDQPALDQYTLRPKMAKALATIPGRM